MAREIKPTPEIEGEDARRFQEAMDNLNHIAIIYVVKWL
jgi:hypothetical protein